MHWYSVHECTTSKFNGAFGSESIGIVQNEHFYGTCHIRELCETLTATNVRNGYSLKVSSTQYTVRKSMFSYCGSLADPRSKCWTCGSIQFLTRPWKFVSCGSESLLRFFRTPDSVLYSPARYLQQSKNTSCRPVSFGFKAF